MQFLIGFVIWGLLFCFTTNLWAGRTMVSLDGKWEVVKVRSLDDPIPSSGWQEINIPGTLYGYNYERAWFRRKIFIPKEWSSSRIILRFGGVKYNSRVLVNGRNVGGCFNGYDAFELDITPAVRFGADNDLLVGVHDWTGVFVGEKVDFEAIQRISNIDLREVPQDRVISPIGGHYYQYGIWNSVYLLAVPGIYIKKTFIRPSIRQNKLEVEVQIANTQDKSANITLKGDIYRWDGKGRDKAGQWGVKGKALAGFPTAKLEIPPGETRSLVLNLDKPPLETWSPFTPNLYVLELKIDQPNGDVLRERFGFREIWIKNGDFYLNGKKVHFLASSWWPPTQGVTREYVAEQITALKKMNAVAFRTHTQPWQDIYYEVADELGMMMIPEAAIWNDDTTYRVFDPKFWENYALHLRSMVRHLYNHPSVVMWSLENELTGSRVNENFPETEENLARMGRIVKTEDPTRPITYESDGDPGGATDVIGIHYPNEFPGRRLWPNDAYWMEEPRYAGGGGGIFWKGLFLWDHKKPLYIGEYLWVPSRDPSTHTLFYGDEAYKDHQTYRTLAKALAWRMQILAYRHYDVSGHSPWTVIEQGPLDERNPCWVAQRDMYRPLAGFIREYDSRFFSGETIQRTVELFNDTMKDLPKVNFKWALLDGKQTIKEGGETLDMKSGAHLERVIKVPLPNVSARKKLTLQVTLSADGAPPFKEEWKIEVFSPLSKALFPKVHLFVYDPKNKFLPNLKDIGVEFTEIKKLQEWKGEGILIIAPEALEAGGVSETPLIRGEGGEEQWLAQQVDKGGKVLIIEQTPSAGDWLPISLDTQSSTFSFPLISNHPILKGITSEDLRWWRGDNLVSINEPIRPMQAGVLPLIVTGTGMGLSHSPLVEIRQGKGALIVCQMRVASKLRSEPMAGLLLGRMLNYLANYEPAKGETLVLASPSLQEKLKALRLDWRPLEDWSELRYPDVKLLILGTDGKAIADNFGQLRRFIEAGGNVLWHRPKQEDLAKLKEIIKINLQQYQGPITRAEMDNQLLSYLSREDLYWLSTPTGPWWQTASLAINSADGVFTSEVALAEAKRFPATKGAKLQQGANISVEGNELAFFTRGLAEWEIDIPETGTYTLGLVARGTPVGGVYPIVEVYLDGAKVGVLYIGSEKLATYICSFSAKAGKHRLGILFTNDAWAPPEDRNLWVESFLLAKGREGENIEVLTSPPALISLPIGKGRLVLSAIRWDEPPSGNGLKARRFISSLLTAFGARYMSSGRVSVIKAERFKPAGEYPFLRWEEGSIAMGTNATVQSEIEVAKAGKYRITIWARGTPAEGVYPIVVFEIDGREIGRVECKGEDWSPHSIIAELPAGKHIFSLSFINDLWRPPEDRNLWISRVEFEPLE